MNLTRVVDSRPTARVASIATPTAHVPIPYVVAISGIVSPHVRAYRHISRRRVARVGNREVNRCTLYRMRNASLFPVTSTNRSGTEAYEFYLPIAMRCKAIRLSHLCPARRDICLTIPGAIYASTGSDLMQNQQLYYDYSSYSHTF